MTGVAAGHVRMTNGSRLRAARGLGRASGRRNVET